MKPRIAFHSNGWHSFCARNRRPGSVASSAKHCSKMQMFAAVASMNCFLRSVNSSRGIE